MDLEDAVIAYGDACRRDGTGMAGPHDIGVQEARAALDNAIGAAVAAERARCAKIAREHSAWGEEIAALFYE